jgi:hypothetical protein
MSVYRLLFIDEQNQVRDVKILPYEGDAWAVRVASACSDGRARELWRNGRLVSRFPAAPPAPSGADDDRPPTQH